MKTKNKIELKNYLLIYIILIVFLITGFILLNKLEYNFYKKNTNNKIYNIISLLEKEYPSVDKNEIINILNNEESISANSLKKYGIDLSEDSLILQNDKKHKEFKIINAIYLLVSIILLTLVFIIYLNKKSKRIKEITKSINKINNKIYSLDLNTFTEDELSKLENELYKTTILLKEQAENSLKDKDNIKASLEDISHQLKTPLTSINLCLDNLLENEEIDEITKNEFLHTIKREISSMNFLIISLLKLSKFETNTVKFEKIKCKVIDLIESSNKKVSLLSDLKNIKVNIECNKNIFIKCDPSWEVEAISNILKNAIEHSKEDSTVNISVKENKFYTEIRIKNLGTINKKDLPHIFERFYKGENASKDSIGIGLALSKSIIEKDNGKITIDLNENTTTFVIKYFV